MVWHLVLMRPRPDLSFAERHALADSFVHACRQISAVREVTVGRRILHGAGYESAAPDVADVVIVLAFDDLAGLQLYLADPAHEELGRRFGQSCAGAATYDFEVGGIDLLSRLVDMR
jgi:hypothetical protein